MRFLGECREDITSHELQYLHSTNLLSGFSYVITIFMSDLGAKGESEYEYLPHVNMNLLILGTYESVSQSSRSLKSVPSSTPSNTVS